MTSSVKLGTGTARQGNVPVDYYVAGPADAPTVVLVHGTGGSAARHYGVLQPLLASRFRTVSFDWADPEDGDLTIEQLVGQLESVLEASDAQGPVTLVGYSLGAAVALAAAARLREQVASLVLVAGWIKTDNHQSLRNRIWQILRDEGSAALAEYQVFCALGAPYVQTKPYALVQGAIDNAPSGNFFDRQMDLNSRVDVESALADVTAAALVVACRYDQMVPVRHQKYLFGGLSDARYVELESGHAVLQERPAELYQLITDFVSDSTRHPAGAVLERPAV